MGRYILTLHSGHNSAALIGDETGVLFAIQEERLTGEKNYWGFPRNAVRACMEHVGAKASDLVSIGYGGHQVVSRYHSRDDILKAYRRQDTVVGKLRQRIAMPLVLAVQPNLGQRSLQEDLGSVGLGDVPIAHYDHHYTHAVTAYYGLRKNPRERYLVATCDGAGDGLCGSLRVFGGGEVTEISRSDWDDSLGALYSWVTFAMGFMPLEHEYKLMGMAPYASERAANEAADTFRAYLGLSDDGLTFKRKTLQRTNDLGERIFADMRGKRFDHICAGLQLFTEELLMSWIKSAVKKTGISRVLAAGGVFMNVKANKRIAELAEVTSFEAFPSCGDETLPFGVFWAEAAKRYGDATVKPLDHFYFGDDLDPRKTEDEVRASGYRFEAPSDMAEAVGDLLVAGQPVARAAGRMEFGARALGNRSILADPKQGDVVRVINQMVKKRDFWMPFAPIVLDSRQHDYLLNAKDLASPFMMMTFDTKPSFRDLIAAVHNADLTCRAQILREDQNPPVYAILKAFEKKTGRGVILNTSFNLHGYPIVRDAREALHVFRSSGLEHIQVGSFLLHKS
jgi:carbamoyltransferase